MTVDVGTGDFTRYVRVHTGRALIAVSRHLSRVGARLLGHPSAGSERVIERAALQIVRDSPSQSRRYGA